MEPRLTNLHITDSKSIAEYGYHEDKNFPVRKSMEDNYIAVDDFYGDGSGFFGILDGHGGAEVSEYCATALPNLFQQEYSKNKTDVKGAFERALAKADDQLKLVGATECGTTCCLAFIKSNENNRLAYIANLGDTRAVLCENGMAKRVSTDHKISNQSEQERIRKEGGLILKGRVGGQLAVTRALGDLMLKSEGVSNVPDLECFQINPSTEYLIIASDGLWDVCSDQKAVELTRNLPNTKDMAKQLLQFALKNNTQDNVSILVLKFNK